MNSITDLLGLEDACYTRPYLIPSRTLIILLFLFNYISYIDSSTAKNTTLTQYPMVHSIGFLLPYLFPYTFPEVFLIYPVVL